MRMSLVTYRKTFNLGSFQSESIGVEMELNEGDSATKALDNCAALVDEYHVKTLANLDEFRGTSTRTIEAEEKLNPLQASLDEIAKCETLEELKSCWLMSKGNLTLSAAYKTKEKQLTDAK